MSVYWLEQNHPKSTQFVKPQITQHYKTIAKS